MGSCARVEAELSDRALGSSARINVGETRGVVVGFIRNSLAWREQHQINWTTWAVILAFAVGIAVVGIGIFLIAPPDVTVRIVQCVVRRELRRLNLMLT